MDIVIVDDEPKIRDGLSKLLDGKGNWYMTGTYTDTMDVLRNMAFYGPGAIITDIKTSEINGLDMTDRMRETDQEACIIIFSSYSDFGSAQRTIELRATRRLIKPARRRKLLGVLEETEGKMSEKRKGGEEKKEVSNPMVRKAIDYIALSYPEKISLENITEELYLSPNYLSELLKRHTDKNTSEYITQLYPGKARHYLQQPECRIVDVSDLVGLGNPRYFSSMSKCQHGMIPNEYRNKNIK